MFLLAVTNAIAQYMAKIDAERKAKLMADIEADPSKESRDARRRQIMREIFLKRLGDRDTRMATRMERRREQIIKRNWMIVWNVFFWCAAPAVAITILAALWRSCIWAVMS